MSYNGPLPEVVKAGGTANSSFTAYSLICGGTTSTGALQNVSGVGSSSQVLTSNGPSALPSWQNASGGSGITTINGDSGSVTGSTVTLTASNPTNDSGASVTFTGSSTTMQLSFTDGFSNTFLGIGSGVIGSVHILGNTAVGRLSLASLSWTAGPGIDGNNAFGSVCLNSLVSGIENCGFGGSCLSGVTTGNYNSCFGAAAGSSYAGAESNNICIGHFVNGTAGESNKIRIGNSSNNACYVTGIAGATLSAGSPTPYLSLVDATDGQIISPVPVAANSASSTYGSLVVGTALQNTANYPILVNVSLDVTTATTAVVLVGVGPTSTPTAQAVTDSFTAAAAEQIGFSFVVPSKYYAKVTTTGTITIANITTFVSQIG